ncbi:hypothetical protein DPX16_0800 [Anabarilius grahami]|uniref:Uncharacterized protein n=1 Tax=Anabarilius grahami TaxID=495550 RepID=A0A3N0Z9I2_ANAGA|nr:hypothetical protein DPX16_0800 [Anabarilius grahami]
MAQRTKELRRRLNMSNWPKKSRRGPTVPTVRNTLRKLSRPMKKNCPTTDRRLFVIWEKRRTDPFIRPKRQNKKSKEETVYENRMTIQRYNAASAGINVQAH